MKDKIEFLNLSNNDKLKEISTLNLAYIGDAVFEILVRTKMVEETKSSVNELHRKARELVNATSQSRMYHKILNLLTDEEVDIIRRGRNKKSSNKAKNSTMIEYKHATGLEALFGYLYLKGDMYRLKYLFNKCIGLDKT